jgi:hypothetical protein
MLTPRHSGRPFRIVVLTQAPGFTFPCNNKAELRTRLAALKKLASSNTSPLCVSDCVQPRILGLYTNCHDDCRQPNDLQNPTCRCPPGATCGCTRVTWLSQQDSQPYCWGCTDALLRLSVKLDKCLIDRWLKVCLALHIRWPDCNKHQMVPDPLNDRHPYPWATMAQHGPQACCVCAQRPK